MTEVPTVTLANGVEMPALGFGTSPMGDAAGRGDVPPRCEAGYRLIDTAENYRNEARCRRGIRASGLDRDELFVTTKFNKRWHGEDAVQQAFANSAERLGLDHIDLLLIHWPNPRQDRYVDAWGGSSSSSRTAWSARSASPTSSPRTSTGSSTRPASRRTSTRSSSIRGTAGPRSARTTPSTAS